MSTQQSMNTTTATITTTPLPAADLSGAQASQDQPKGYIETAKEFVAVQIDNLTNTIAPAPSTTNSVPQPPHGVPPSNEQSALVADQDKTLTQKVGETYEQVKEVAQQTIQAASQTVTDISYQVAGNIEHIKDATTSTLYGVQTPAGATPPPPHGIPPSNEQSALVADQDKTLTQKVGETYEQVKEAAQEKLVETKKLAGEYVAGANQIVREQAANLTEVTVQTVSQVKDTTVSTLSQAGSLVGLTSQIQPGVTPEAPHGVPPSDFEKATVSDQDKTLLQIGGEKLEGAREAAGEKFDQAKKVVAEYADSANQIVREQVGNISQSISENYVQIKDATVTTVITVKDTTAATINQAGSLVGLTSQIQPGVTPEVPHGVPPTNFHAAVVSEQDKNLIQKGNDRLEQAKEAAGEKLEEAKKVVAEYADSTNKVVMEQVNNVSQTVSDNYAQIKDTTVKTAAQVQDVTASTLNQVGIPVATQSGVTPDAPHGVPPTNFHAAVVSEQDKTLLQKGSEKLEEVKEAAGEKMEQVKVFTFDFAANTNEAAKEKVNEVSQKGSEKLEEVKEAVGERLEEARSSLQGGSM